LASPGFVGRQPDRVTDALGFEKLVHLGIGDGRIATEGSQPNEEGVIVTSRINGLVPIEVDWQLNPSDNGYKVTNLFVSGIDMARMQRSDLVSVVRRNSGHVQALLVALREKNASNGILRY
jgi:ABC-type transporter MlaC component